MCTRYVIRTETHRWFSPRPETHRSTTDNREKSPKRCSHIILVALPDQARTSLHTYARTANRAFPRTTTSWHTNRSLWLGFTGIRIYRVRVPSRGGDRCEPNEAGKNLTVGKKSLTVFVTKLSRNGSRYRMCRGVLHKGCVSSISTSHVDPDQRNPRPNHINPNPKPLGGGSRSAGAVTRLRRALWRRFSIKTSGGRKTRLDQ